MTDQQLQLALAKMLPEKIDINPAQTFFSWIPDNNSALFREVLDTEWLHVCWLVEQTLTWQEHASYKKNLTDYKLCASDQDKAYISASWQQRAEALCKVKGIA